MPSDKNPKPEDVVIAYEPDRTIRGLIGNDTKLEDIFTKERIEAGQKVIDTARDSFFDVISADLEKLESLVKAQNPAEEVSDPAFEDIAVLATNIKGHAGLFGFTLIATTCSHIAEYCEPGPHSTTTRFRLLTDLVKMLRLVVNQKISDEHGRLSRELKASLQKE